MAIFIDVRIAFESIYCMLDYHFARYFKKIAWEWTDLSGCLYLLLIRLRYFFSFLLFIGGLCKK